MLSNLVTIISLGYNILTLRGGVSEWLKETVLKTVEPVRAPGVRIPPPPYCSFQIIWLITESRSGKSGFFCVCIFA